MPDNKTSGEAHNLMKHGKPMTHAMGALIRAAIAPALIACALLVSWTAHRAEAQSVGGNPLERPVLFLANESLPPLNFMKDGRPTGLVVDLANALAKRMHRPVEVRLTNWAQAQQLVLSGEADALLQINMSPERLKIYDFSEPLLTSEFSIFTTNERRGVTSFYDLRGLRVGVERMGLPDLLLRQDQGINVQNIPDFLQGFRMLLAGELDAVVADHRVGSYVLAENNIRGVKVTEEPVSLSDSAIAVKKGNLTLLEEINSALADIRRDGSYERIVKSWQTKEVVFQTVDQLRRQNLLIAAVLAALILSLIGIAALIREIRRRKRTEAMLRESEERFRLALRNAPVSVAVQDRDLRYIWAYNQRTARPEEIIGHLDHEIFTEEEAARLTAIKRRVVDENIELRDQMWFNRPSGPIFLDVCWTPIRDGAGKVVGVACATVDLTPIKLAEEALRQSEKRYRMLHESLRDAFVQVSIDGKIIEFNDLYCRMLGYSPDELRALAYQDLTPERWHSFEEQIVREQIVARGYSDVYEKEYRRKDGTIFPVEIRTVLSRDESGRAIAMWGIIRDITERKRLENELRESEERLRLFIEHAPASLAMFDCDMRYLSASRRWLADYKLGDRDLAGLSHYEVFPEISDEWKDIHRRALAGEVVRAESDRFARLDGSVQWLRWETRPWHDASGKVGGIVIFSEDITVRKIAEDAVRESEQKFRTIFRVIPDILAISSWDGRTLDINHEYSHAFGYTRDEVIGKTSLELGFWSDLKERDALRELLNAQGGVRDFEAHFRAKSGEVKTALLSVEAIEVEGQRCMISLMKDISERKLMEEQLRKSNDELELRVQERTAELRLSNKALMEYAAKLERLNKELQDFAFVAAHDLQEPLRKIQTFCDMAISRCSPALDSAGKAYLDKVLDLAGRMRDLLHNLLLYSGVAERPESFKQIDLGGIAREAADLFEEDFEKTGGRIEIGDLPSISADETQMLRLFENLIGNALKYRGAESPRIKIHAKLDEGRCEILVEDNGIGFEQQYAERIFRPFQRLHRRSEYGGEGMGLAICRKIVEWHGGTIRAESKPGTGSKFILELPVKHDRREMMQ